MSSSTSTRLAPVGHGVHATIVIPIQAGWRNRTAGGVEPDSDSRPPLFGSAAIAALQEDSRILERASGLKVLKLVVAPKNGFVSSRRPHDVVREVRVLERAHHPNVVKLLAYSYDDARIEHILSLPLLAVTLFDVLRADVSRTHPVELFLPTAKGLFAGLAHLHQNAVAHRDIKPANVMLAFDGTPVLIDFGTAWDGDSRGDGEGSMSCSVGSGPYRAPELLFSPETYDPKALDLWSAGVTLAEFFRPRGKRPSSLGISDSSDTTNSNPSSASNSNSNSHPAGMEQEGTPRAATTGTMADPTLYKQAQTDNGVNSGSLVESLARLDVKADGGKERGLGAELEPPAPLFSATFGELGLAASIFRLLGTPTPETWPSFDKLPDAGKMPFDEYVARPVREALELASLSGAQRTAVIDILEHLVVLEPARRRTAHHTHTHLATLPALPGPPQTDTADIADGDKVAAAVLRPLLLEAARRFA